MKRQQKNARNKYILRPSRPSNHQRLLGSAVQQRRDASDAHVHSRVGLAPRQRHDLVEARADRVARHVKVEVPQVDDQLPRVDGRRIGLVDGHVAHHLGRLHQALVELGPEEVGRVHRGADPEVRHEDVSAIVRRQVLERRQPLQGDVLGREVAAVEGEGLVGAVRLDPRGAEAAAGVLPANVPVEPCGLPHLLVRGVLVAVRPHLRQQRGVLVAVRLHLRQQRGGLVAVRLYLLQQRDGLIELPLHRRVTSALLRRQRDLHVTHQVVQHGAGGDTGA